MAGLSHAEEDWNGLHRKLRELIDEEVNGLDNFDEKFPESVDAVQLSSVFNLFGASEPRDYKDYCLLDPSDRFCFDREPAKYIIATTIIHSPTYPLLETLCSRDSIKSKELWRLCQQYGAEVKRPNNRTLIELLALDNAVFPGSGDRIREHVQIARLLGKQPPTFMKPVPTWTDDAYEGPGASGRHAFTLWSMINTASSMEANASGICNRALRRQVNRLERKSKKTGRAEPRPGKLQSAQEAFSGSGRLLKKPDRLGFSHAVAGNRSSRMRN